MLVDSLEGMPVVPIFIDYLHDSDMLTLTDIVVNQVLMEFHGVLDRHSLLLQACETDSVSQQDLIDLGRAGLGTCLLAGLPGWLVAYTAHLVIVIAVFCSVSVPML
jgi:hypothetical protein